MKKSCSSNGFAVVLLAAALLSIGHQDANAQAAKKSNALVDVPGAAGKTPARPSCEVRAAAGTSAVECSIDVTKPLGRFGASFGSIDFAVPQPKGSETITLGSLDGLARSYTLGMSAGLIFGPPDSPTTLLGMSAKAGPQSYSWYDPASLKKSSDRRSSYSVDGYGGLVFGEGHANAAYLRLSRQSVSRDAKSRILCPVSTSAVPVECVNGPIGAPVKSVANVVTLQYSRLFDASGTGMSVSISRNTTDRVTGIEVPIYLVSMGTEKTPLRLGISAGWTNDPNSARRGTLAVIFSTSSIPLLAN